jgi:membrane-bound lytic murein transglycosylase D
MFQMKKLLLWARKWPSFFERPTVLPSRRLTASGWYTLRGRARKSADRVVQLVILSFALGALLIDWTGLHRFAGEVEARWSRNEVVPSDVVQSALADMERELADAELPIDNERVEYWMLRFSTSDKREFEETLSRAGLYSDMIRNKIRARGMPEELVYLAMIESGFLTNARSRVAATGMWQFMDPTARAYGLRIDGYVDERRDPVKATDAALEYLGDLYQQYNSWYLAAAAYNAGSTRVSLALARQSSGRAGEGSADDYGEGNFYGEGEGSLYWEIVDHLPKETAQYVPKLLAATYLARYADQFELDVTLADPYVYDLVWAPGATSLADLGELMGLPDDRIRELNPQLIRGMTPPGNVYALRIPVGQGYQAMAALAAPGRRSRLADD